jgi:brefeldin A-resistance guanine nucleotide exchange factor 1
MHELIRFIFSHLPDVENTNQALVDGVATVKQEV